MKLVVGVPERRFLLGRVLQFDHRQREAVDKQHDVGAPVALVFDDGELVDDQKVVGVGVVSVDEPDLVVSFTVVGTPGDIDAVGQHSVETAVVFDE